MKELLPVQVTGVAARQIREAEAWWRLNRTAAPNAIQEELQRAFALVASQPDIGGRAANVKLPNVRRIYLHESNTISTITSSMHRSGWRL